MKRWMLPIFFLTWAGSAEAQSLQDERQVVSSFLQSYCIDCHGPEKSKADIRFDTIQEFRIQDRDLWTLASTMVAEGEMPPDDAAQPDAESRQSFLEAIEAAQRSMRLGATRRLNRRELSATLQDLTGLAVDYAYALPADGRINGFDTVATALTDTADSVNRTLEITRRAVQGIRFRDPNPALILEADLRNVKDVRKSLDAWKDQDVYTKPRGHGRPEGLYINPKWLGNRGEFAFNLPPDRASDSVLKLEIWVAAKTDHFEDLPNPYLWVEIGNRVIDRREIANPPDQPLHLTYEIQTNDLPLDKRGLEIMLHNKVETPYRVEGFENEDRSRKDDPMPGGTGLYRPLWDRKVIKTPEETPAPYLVLSQIRVEYGHQRIWPTPDSLATDATLETARRLLATWTTRAWRRDLETLELKPFMDLYKNRRKLGDSFDDALRTAFQAVLMSPQFRFLKDPFGLEPAGAQLAIASRLSFMLTGSPPDQRLRTLAQNQKLRDPATLAGQVERLVQSSDRDAFVRPFLTQWLELDQPITIAMRTLQHQDFRFGRLLKDSMREETVAYFERLLIENRPLRELIDSDWTMMNASLARHYGYDHVAGSSLRPVSLNRNDPRGGGIMGHAGIQSMLTWMGENWVIYRGAWALRTVLDDPPPAPPLEVPELTPSEPDNHGKTYRELLEQHQKDPLCSVCHQTMDPLGFGFQNFDLSGRWRDVEYERYVREEIDGKIAWNGKGETRPVDTLGALPNGEPFSTYAEMKQLIVQRYMKDIALGVLKRWTLYGTGAAADTAALKEFHEIVADLEPNGLRALELLKAFIQSDAFMGAPFDPK